MSLYIEVLTSIVSFDTFLSVVDSMNYRRYVSRALKDGAVIIDLLLVYMFVYVSLEHLSYFCLLYDSIGLKYQPIILPNVSEYITHLLVCPSYLT